MDKEEMINKYGIEFAIQAIAPMISEKIDEYQKTRNDEVKKKLAELLIDRDKIYNNDKETIKKYVQIVEEN